MRNKKNFELFLENFNLLKTKKQELEDLFYKDVEGIEINKEEQTNITNLFDEIKKALNNPLYNTLAKGDISKQLKEIADLKDRYILREHPSFTNYYNNKRIVPVLNKKGDHKKTFVDTLTHGIVSDLGQIILEPITSARSKLLKSKIVNNNETFCGTYHFFKFDDDVFKEEERHLKLIESLISDENNFSLALEVISDLLNRVKNAIDYLESVIYGNKDLEEIDRENKAYIEYTGYLTNEH